MRGGTVQKGMYCARVNSVEDWRRTKEINHKEGETKQTKLFVSDEIYRIDAAESP